jgi:hypothetical protein
MTRGQMQKNLPWNPYTRISAHDPLRIIMATVVGSRRIRSRTMKTNPSSAQIIESERIIKRDGFSYFLIPDD